MCNFTFLARSNPSCLMSNLSVISNHYVANFSNSLAPCALLLRYWLIIREYWLLASVCTRKYISVNEAFIVCLYKIVLLRQTLALEHVQFDEWRDWCQIQDETGIGNWGQLFTAIVIRTEVDHRQRPLNQYYAPLLR